MKSILLVCSYFGPETSVGVNRVNSFVRHWLNQGISIDVITMPYRDELPLYLQNQDGLTIHQVAPLFLSSTAQSFGRGPSISKSRVKRVLHWFKKNIFANYLDPRTLWWPRAAAVANRLCQQKTIDVVLTSVPSYTAHSIGAVVKYFHPSVFWVADYRDLWSDNPIFPGTALVRWVERCHERFILKRSDLIVTINDDLATALHRLHGTKKTLVVPNGYEPSELEPLTHDTMNQKDYFSIVYTGTVLPGLQDPEPLFQAVMDLIQRNLISDTILKLFFYGEASAIRDTVAFRFLRGNGVIQLLGRVTRNVSLNAQRGADMLLFLGSRPLKGGAGIKGVVSGKIFEYLVSGVEIMAIGVTDTMIVAEMIQLAGVGDTYAEDVMKIERRILELVQNGRVKVTPKWDYLTQFDRATQAKALLSAIEKEII